MRMRGARPAFIATTAPLPGVSSFSSIVGNRGGRCSYSPKRSSSKAINEANQEDQLPGTHFGLSLGHGPGSWSKSHRDHARGLLSQQWNMGFP